jgi:hypothetical protein
MSKQYHRPPFNEANLVMSAETTKAAKTTADTTKTAGSPKAGAHAANAANTSDSAHHHLVRRLNCTKCLGLVWRLLHVLRG